MADVHNCGIERQYSVEAGKVEVPIKVKRRIGGPSVDRAEQWAGDQVAGDELAGVGEHGYRTRGVSGRKQDSGVNTEFAQRHR